MTRLFAWLLAITLSSLADPVSAEEVRGTIRALPGDPTTPPNTLVLEDGTTFRVVEGVDFGDIEPGVEVEVHYEVRDGTKTAIEIKRAE